MRVGLLYSRLRVEEKRIGEALTVRGATVAPLAEDEVAFDLHGRGYDALDVVVDRCQDYTLAQTALRAFEHLGVRTVNRPATVDLCGNKLLMNAALIRAGLLVPRGEVALGPGAALAAIERMGYPVVTKPLVGGNSQLLALIEDREAAEAVIEHKAMLGTDRHHVYYLEEYVAKPGRDIRVLVVGDTVLAAEYRASRHWVTRGDRHATHEPCPLTTELAALALAAARALGGGVLEVDLFESDRGLMVNEVSSVAEFRTFETKGGVDVAGALAEHILAVARQPAPATDGRERTPYGRV